MLDSFLIGVLGIQDAGVSRLVDGATAIAKKVATDELAVATTTDQLSTGDWVVYGMISAALIGLFLIALRPRKTSGKESFGEIASNKSGLSDHSQTDTLQGMSDGAADQSHADSESNGEAAQSSVKIESAGRTLRDGLQRTNKGFVQRLSSIFGQEKQLGDDLLGELEEVLFTADIGVRTSQRLVTLVEDKIKKASLADPHAVWALLKSEIRDILTTERSVVDFSRSQPFVIMVVGVNGAGKTTTIGKLAKQFTDDGKKVLLAAGDTFRAAAVDQLAVWAERAGVDVVRGSENQDPASVLFEAVKKAETEGVDIVLADTAGRLQAKKGLMDELSKVHRVMGKALAGAPHEVWLVLDSTNGQNAISQAKEFQTAVDVTGLILTKLDGTAKGGVAIGICDEMGLPIRYIGIGEGVEDLRVFDPAAFADALLGDESL